MKFCPDQQQQLSDVQLLSNILKNKNKKGKKAVLLPLSYCFCAIPVLSKQQVGLCCCLKFMEEWERLLSCYEYFATCLHFYSSSQVLTRSTTQGFLFLFPTFLYFYCAFKDMRVEGKAKQESDGHLLRFFPSPDLKFVISRIHISRIYKEYFVFWS